jgi:hypothetical protein
MSEYYECHITIEPKPGEMNKTRDDIESMGWKFSSIDGDPVLGVGAKHYATKHYRSDLGRDSVLSNITLAAERLREQGHVVIREKIERVIWDTASAKVKW